MANTLVEVVDNYKCQRLIKLGQVKQKGVVEEI